MMISTKGRYALRLMLDLAEQETGEPISLKDAAARQDISMKYLEAIASALNRGGLLRSQRGKDGGYRLSRPADQITMAELLRCTEGTLAPVNCSSLEGTPCVRAEECRSLPLWQALDRHVDDFLSRITLEDVLVGRIS